MSRRSKKAPARRRSHRDNPSASQMAVAAGIVGVGAGVAYLLWPSTANAADLPGVPPVPPGPGTPVTPTPVRPPVTPPAPPPPPPPQVRPPVTPPAPPPPPPPPPPQVRPPATPPTQVRPLVPPPAPPPPPPPSPTGTRGDREIAKLQRILRALGYTLVADGKVGARTADAVSQFQRQANFERAGSTRWSGLAGQPYMTVNGQLDQLTREWLYRYMNSFGRLDQSNQPGDLQPWG